MGGTIPHGMVFGIHVRTFYGLVGGAMGTMGYQALRDSGRAGLETGRSQALLPVLAEDGFQSGYDLAHGGV